MDFAFTREQERWREEVCRWMTREVPEEFDGHLREDDEDIHQWCHDFAVKLSEKGWLTIGWPKEYGGGGRSFMDQALMRWEFGYHRAPVLAHFRGVDFVGHALMHFGTEDQKQQFLPRISRQEVYFCLGFSEPEAGSDLASLTTRAVKEGDHYVVNGTKIFTSGAERADYCALAARTDPDAPKHRGISLFFVDMKSPGITVQPLYNIMRWHRQNIVYFDNVKVPAGALMGEENRGWYHVGAVLTNERYPVNEIAAEWRHYSDLVNFVRETTLNGRVLAQDASVQQQLAEAGIWLKVWNLLSWRVVWLLDRGETATSEAMLSRTCRSIAPHLLAKAGLEILGPYGQLVYGSKWAPLAGEVDFRAKLSAHHGIAPGGLEVHKNAIAYRILGLPRPG